jgi:hypothetical protein
MSEVSAMLRAENAADKFIQTFGSHRNYNKLNDLSIKELRQLNSMIIETLKRKKDDKGFDIKRKLKVDDLVFVDRIENTGDIFTVVKLNPKKAVIEDEFGMKFNCPYALIKIS